MKQTSEFFAANFIERDKKEGRNGKENQGLVTS
jgi:hypothetical protein